MQSNKLRSNVEEANLKIAGAMERVLQELKALIVSGGLSPGEQIRQQEMAEQLKVSRVPLREAMNVLADQGLLFHRPNQGYFVTKRAPGEHAQIRRMLHMLENELMMTIRWPDDSMLQTLRTLNDDMRQRVRDSSRFHRDLNLSTTNLIARRLGPQYVLVDHEDLPSLPRPRVHFIEQQSVVRQRIDIPRHQADVPREIVTSRFEISVAPSLTTQLHQPPRVPLDLPPMHDMHGH